MTSCGSGINTDRRSIFIASCRLMSLTTALSLWWLIIYPDSGCQNSSLKNTALMDNLTIQVNSGGQSAILFPRVFGKLCFAQIYLKPSRVGYLSFTTNCGWLISCLNPMFAFVSDYTVISNSDDQI